jgi:hypothetical protein
LSVIRKACSKPCPFRPRAYQMSLSDNRTTLTFGLTSFRLTSPCPRGTKIAAFSGDYQRPAEATASLRAVAAYPRVASCDRFSYQQAIHILLQHKRRVAKGRHSVVRGDLRETQAVPRPFHPPSVYPVAQVRRRRGPRTASHTLSGGLLDSAFSPHTTKDPKSFNSPRSSLIPKEKWPPRCPAQHLPQRCEKRCPPNSALVENSVTATFWHFATAKVRAASASLVRFCLSLCPFRLPLVEGVFLRVQGVNPTCFSAFLPMLPPVFLRLGCCFSLLGMLPRPFPGLFCAAEHLGGGFLSVGAEWGLGRVDLRLC